MPRPRVHETAAGRVQAHRKRQAYQGMVRMEIVLPAVTAERLRNDAKARGCSVGELIEASLSPRKNARLKPPPAARPVPAAATVRPDDERE